MAFDFDSLHKSESLGEYVSHSECYKITDAYGSHLLHERGYFSGSEKFYISRLFIYPGVSGGYIFPEERFSTLGKYNCIVFEPRANFPFPVKRFEMPLTEFGGYGPRYCCFPALVFQQVYAEIECGSATEKAVPDQSTSLYYVFLGVFKISKKEDALIFDKLWDKHYFDASKISE